MEWRITLVTVALVGLLTAGCIEDQADGPDAVTVADSRASGSMTERGSASCPAGTARLAGMTAVDEGSMELVVEDGEGEEVLRRSYDGETDLDGERLDGNDGDWTVHVETSDDFDGAYSFTLLCRAA